MARKTLKDEKGKEYDVEIPDDEPESDDDGDTLWLDEEDIEWLRKKRREESETERTKAQSGNQSGSGGKVVRIRAKQNSQGSQSMTQNSRRRTLRLA